VHGEQVDVVGFANERLEVLDVVHAPGEVPAGEGQQDLVRPHLEVHPGHALDAGDETLDVVGGDLVARHGHVQGATCHPACRGVLDQHATEHHLVVSLHHLPQGLGVHGLQGGQGRR